MTNLVVKYSLLAFPLASAGLGVWQLKRLEWKKNLISNLEKEMSDEPLDFFKIDSAKELENLEYRRVKTKGHYDQDPSHQLYLKPRQLIVNDEAILRGRTAHQSNIGVNVITPFHVDGSNLKILVNRGWLALRGRDNVQDCAHIGLTSKDNAQQELVGIIRKSDRTPKYGLKNNQSTNEWHIRDIEAMSQVLKTAPIFVDAVLDPERKEGPIGGQTQLNIRNEHLNYAITWFGLAVFSYLMWYIRYGKRVLFWRHRGRPGRF